MTTGLPLLTCPSCGRAMISAGGDQPRLTATSFENCVRRCKSCGIGASNALGSQSVTYIHRDPLTNIPEPSREGALDALSAALNIRSRGTKRSRFGFSTSEDAVTWVVFTYLMRSKLLLKALQNVQLAAPDAGHIEPTLLLWGVPVEPTTSGASLRARLSAQCTALGKDKERMSEPDVIVDLGAHGIVFIEVKYLSGNDKKSSSYAGWEKYKSVGALVVRSLRPPARVNGYLRSTFRECLRCGRCKVVAQFASAFAGRSRRWRCPPWPVPS